MVRDAGMTSFVRVYGTWVRVRRQAVPWADGLHLEYINNNKLEAASG